MTISAIVTAYCAASCCCPSPRQPTASGAWPREGVTVAAPRSVPLGTRVTIDGRPYVVQDRTARRWSRAGRWDIFVNSHARAKQLGVRRVTITINP